MYFDKVLAVFTIFFVGVLSVEFQIVNEEEEDIWVGVQGNSGHDHLNNGGFAVAPYQQVSVYAPDNWAGRFWARTFCDVNTKHCLTGDCENRLECAGVWGKPPASLVEITLNDHEGLDLYYISLIHGFNVKVSIAPIGGQSDGGHYSCKRAGCDIPINNHCPDKLQLRSSNSSVIGCKSACVVFNIHEYCCTGPHAFRWTCKPSNWQRNYPAMFKEWCPDARSYRYDEQTSMFTCRNVSAYRIEFGG